MTNWKVWMKSLIIGCILFLLSGTNVFAAEGIVEDAYQDTLRQWGDEGVKQVAGQRLQFIQVKDATDAAIVAETESFEYGSDVIRLNTGDHVTLRTTVKEAGLYAISVDYYCLAEQAVSHTISLKVNGQYPFSEARELVLQQLYDTEEYPFRLDRNGNEITPDTMLRYEWQTQLLRAIAQGGTQSLLFYLEAGENEIEITMQKASVLLGEVYAVSAVESPDYAAYVSMYPQVQSSGQVLPIEAERISFKNTTSARPVATRDVMVTPYVANTKLMSVIGGDTWNQNGQTLYYEVDVKNTGWYYLALKYKQNQKENTVVRRTITIDNELPFAEASGVPFDSSTSWVYQDAGRDGEAYMFYLEEGTHVIGLEADSTGMVPVSSQISEQIDLIADITVEIKKITGGSDDVNRDWEILSYIPDLDRELNVIADKLEEVMGEMITLNLGNEGNKDISNMKIIISRLRGFADDPDQLPNHLASFSEGAGSVSQMLGEILDSISQSPLTVDSIYLYQEGAELPEFEVSIFRKFWEEFRFFLSDLFGSEEEKTEEEMVTIDIWVNRAITYVNEMQTMTDAYFTPESGIKVNFSVMKDESKLILANTTNTQPDVALGLSSHLPYDLAIRGVLADLRTFGGFEETASQFLPGAFLTHTYGDGIYALPETQDFYVLFYRTDLCEALNIEPPDTWEEALGILPVLQRYGMNFYIPLASSNSFKTFSMTLPFFLQYGGAIYDEGGMNVAVNNENGLSAMKFMTDLFTIYGLPTEVADFYQSFRNGVIPMGVSNYGTYLKLNAAAAELAGKWKIVVMPGVENENGEVERWSTGAGTAGVIFAKSKKQEAAWEFLKWWTSTETQSRFGTQIQLLYGDTYMWNTANVEAFSQLPIAEEDKEVIMDQWQWLYEFVKTPASYMIERELSNVWNSVVFDGENVRSALDDASILMNQELNRKWEEFGYLENGNVVKSYQVPSIELIEGWVNKDE